MALLRTSRRPWSFVALCYADRAYAEPRVAEATPITTELVGPKPRQRGFAAQPCCWETERSFAWTARGRRLARDQEVTPRSGIASSSSPLPPSCSGAWRQRRETGSETLKFRN
jgi:putative transposase